MYSALCNTARVPNTHAHLWQHARNQEQFRFHSRQLVFTNPTTWRGHTTRFKQRTRVHRDRYIYISTMGLKTGPVTPHTPGFVIFSRYSCHEGVWSVARPRPYDWVPSKCSGAACMLRPFLHWETFDEEFPPVRLSTMFVFCNTRLCPATCYCSSKMSPVSSYYTSFYN